jgi:retron-type reverse transcriptase
MDLYKELKNGTYKHSGYTSFYVTVPKLRKIEKSQYIDRVVHTWLVDNFLLPYFVPRFINTTYACIRDRGMHRACLDVKNTMKHCRAMWNNYYILKMDVSKYFDSIDKEILLKILNRTIKDKKLMWLIKKILYAQDRSKGLEIGNYTSQMFANIYLNEVDQFVKNELHQEYYFRYMDDSIIMVKTKKEAQKVKKQKNI